MSHRVTKAEFTASIYRALMAQASLNEEEIDGMRLVQMMSGILVETLLLFDDPDDGLEASYARLAELLDTEPAEGRLGSLALPPAYIIDYETEHGRAVAKNLFEEWLSCGYEFHQLVLFVVHNIIVRMEQSGQSRAEVFRLFIECTNRCMAYEIAAQELCDIVIDKMVSNLGWSLMECVSALGASSGRALALSQDACSLFSIPSVPDKLDQVSYVMTQEAVRLGVPAGTDWRFGLAANDCHVSAPFELIDPLEGVCQELFQAIHLTGYVNQSVAYAKAAGRMLAIAAGGEEPEIEPVIAKPLAMGAMTDTYKTVCQVGREGMLSM